MLTHRVLLIDDDEDDYILTKEILRESTGLSFELHWCSKPEEALSAMLREAYDVYLVDYRLGRYSGIDLLNEAIKSGCSKPIIILTGKGDPVIDQEALRLGAADYLVKDQINNQLLERSIRYAVEHFQTIQKLKNSENKFKIIFDRAKDPMLITDAKGKIYDANPAALGFFEVSKEELLRKNADELYRNKNSRKIFTNSLSGKGSITDLELEYITASGKPRYCSVSSFMQIAEKGDTELFYTILHDVTYRKMQEKDFILEEKLSAVERIAKNLADDIFSPLSNIHLALDELKENMSRQEDFLLYDLIKKNCESISKLTTNLINSTQASTLSIKKSDLREVLFTTAAEAESLYNVEIDIYIADTPVWFFGDENKLSIALSNIFENIADSIEVCKRVISVNVLESAKEITLEIIDRGAFLPNQDLTRIFEPYYMSNHQSSGLRLTHSQRIIQAHDGRIEFTSRNEEGTTVTITLPKLRG